MPQHDLIPIAYREPFAVHRPPWRDVRPHGETILQMVETVPNLPRGFIDKGGMVCINGEPVPRALWLHVRPKPPSDLLPVSVTLHWPLQSPGGGGGGGNTSKSIIGLVAAIALVAVTAGIGAGFAVPLLGASFAAGTFGAAALAGAVGIGGALAISALTAPPTSQPAAQIANDSNTDNRDPAGASGNTISQGGSIPRVVGTRKVFPPFVCEPVVQVINTLDERVEAVLALNGPHVISDIKIDGVDITSQDIESETKPGDLADTALTLVTRQGRTTNLNLTLSQAKLDSDDLKLVTNSSADLALWHRFTTFDSPDEVWIQLLQPGGLLGTATDAIWAVPFRLRMREVGDVTWINFPEIHLTGNSVRPARKNIRILWDIGFPGVTNGPIPLKNGWTYANINVPPQAVADATPTAWVAHSYFNDGAGNDYISNGTEAASAVTNIRMSDFDCGFYLASATFPKGRYEFEIRAGSSYSAIGFNGATYAYGGTVKDFFWYFVSGGVKVVPQDQTNSVSTIVITRTVSVWNEHPIDDAQGKFALIALRTTNRQLNRISCTASGVVGTWNGSNWTSVTGASSNPAAHYRDILLGAQNHDPLDATLVDDTGLVDWYTTCNSLAWECNAIIDDMRTQDVLGLLASCGYARPYQSDLYGVIVDDDRSADAPVQVFSRINSANMHYEKAFARVPSGLIISYHRATKDYELDQEIVLQTDPSVGVTGLYETITYDGLVTQGRVAARGKFDLDQANLRSTFYTLDADIESLVCRRGSLVAIQHDILTSRAGDAHIKTVLTSGGNITGLVLDAEIPVVSGSTGVAIRRSAGSITTHQISNATGDTSTITFTTPFAIPPGNTIIGFDDTDAEYGCLVVSGDLATEYKRMLVHTITPTKDLKANVVLVDEAQDLVRFGE